MPNDPSPRIELSRRTMLRGLGVALALPWLEGLPLVDPRPPAGGAGGKPPLRAAWLTTPSGVHREAWSFTQRMTELPPTLAPLKDVFAEVLLLGGLELQKANGNGDGPGDHARETGTVLTGVQLKKTAGADIKAGISVDQLAAQKIGHRTLLPSLELGIDHAGQNGSCDSGYSCAYSSNVSWRNETTAMPPERIPRAVFERMFSDMRQNRGARAAGSHVALKQSVLDLVAEDAASLSRELGREDGRKLDEYLESVREMERRVQHAEQHQRVGIDKPEMDLPDGAPGDYVEHVRLMHDLMVLAFKTDTTRLCTFMFGRGGSGRAYTHLGVNGGHHALTHHGGDQSKIADVKKINRHHVELFAEFVAKLKAVPEGDGSLLDHCMIFYGSGTGDGDRHDHRDLPIIVAGQGHGSIRTGRPVQQCKGNLCDLHLGFLHRLGVTVPTFGDGSKPLPDLLD